MRPARLLVFQAVALAFDGDGGRVVKQPIEHGGGDHLVAGEDLGPLAVALVAREDDRARVRSGGRSPRRADWPGPASSGRKPISSRMRTLGPQIGAKPARHRCRPFSASARAATMAATVVNFTCRRLLMAASPRATARWVLPTPGGPRRMTFSARSTKAQPASSRSCFWLTEGWKAKSKSSRRAPEGERRPAGASSPGRGRPRPRPPLPGARTRNSL